MNDVREARIDGAQAAQPGLAGRADTAMPASACGRLPRLLKRREFLAAAAGRRVHSSRMTVQIFERPTRDRPAEDVTSHHGGGLGSGPRFGLTVTKKTANAVGRNRIRRRLRGLLCKLRPWWPEGDIDFVIVGRAEMLTAKADVIEADLKRAFSSPPRQGNPRARQGQTPPRGRGKGDARSRNAIQQDPTGGS